MIYISGKISGVENNNANQFNKKWLELTLKGSSAINPNGHVIHGNDSNWNSCMRRCIQLLMHCDAIYMMKGWEASKGANIEHNIAKMLDMKIIYEE